MKKVLLTLVALVALTTSSFAQKVNEASLKDGIAKAKEATENPKKAIKGATWIALGQKLNEIGVATSSSIFQGMSETEVVMLVGKPGKEGEYSVETINGVDYKKFTYPMIDLYLESDKLSFWNETKTIYPNAFQESLAAFKKAIEVEAKSTDKAVEAMKLLLNNVVMAANNKYMMNEYADAAKLFNLVSQIAEVPEMKSEDAQIYKYYAAVASIQGEEFAASIPLFEKLASDGYFEDGDVYYYIGYANEQLEKFDEAEAAYNKGIEAFPTNEKVLNQLINFYLVVKEDGTKVIPFIKKAQESNPDNKLMVFIEGVAYQNMKEFEKAHEAYARATAMDPQYFDAYYNDAIAYVNEADVKVKELGQTDTTNRALQEQIMGEYTTVLKKAADILEKSLTIQPDNRDVMDLIKTVCFRLRDDSDTKYKGLYEKYNEILKQ